MIILNQLILKKVIDARPYKYISPKELINKINKDNKIDSNFIKVMANNIYKNMYFDNNGIKNFTKYLYYNNLCKNKVLARMYICDKNDFTLIDNKIICINNTNIINLIDNIYIPITKKTIFTINYKLQNINNNFWVIKLVT